MGWACLLRGCGCAGLARLGAVMSRPDPTTRIRAHGALLLVLMAWGAAFAWFCPLGWAVACGLALLAVFLAPLD